MNPFRLKTIVSSALLITGCTLASVALAQYVWIDASGSKQYSDMPPPASVPANRILKTPRGASIKAPATAAPATTGDSVSGNAKAPSTLADKNAEFVKRRTEQAEQEKKEAEQARLAAAKAKNCDRARLYQKTLASGVRVVDADKNGERFYLDEAQRAQEERNTREALKACE